MIVYDLQCSGGAHRFEGWFKSSDDFSGQRERGLLICPYCGSADVDKAVQAARLARKGNQRAEPSPAQRHLPVPAPQARPAVADTPVANTPLPPQAVELMHKLARMQAEALKSSRYVGESFADDARAMHYGEREVETIHGQTTAEEAEELIEEGIAVMPLPFPVTPPDRSN